MRWNSWTRIEIVTKQSMPAARARAMTASRSSANSSKSRWQWLSISIGSLRSVALERHPKGGRRIGAPDEADEDDDRQRIGENQEELERDAEAEGLAAE